MQFLNAIMVSSVLAYSHFPSHALMFIGKQIVSLVNEADILKVSSTNTALCFRLLN